MINITITWYNISAIACGVFFLIKFLIAVKTERKERYLPEYTSVLYAAIIYYAIWGGIFWW